MDSEPEVHAMPNSDNQELNGEYYSNNDFLHLTKHTMQGYVVIKKSSSIFTPRKMTQFQFKDFIDDAFFRFHQKAKGGMKWIFYLGRHLLLASIGVRAPEMQAAEIAEFFIRHATSLPESQGDYYQILAPYCELSLRRCVGGQSQFSPYKQQNEKLNLFVVQWANVLRRLFEKPQVIKDLKYFKQIDQELIGTHQKIVAVLLQRLEEEYSNVKQEVRDSYNRGFEEITRLNIASPFPIIKENLSESSFSFNCEVLQILVNHLLKAGVTNFLDVPINLVEMPIMTTISGQITFRKRNQFEKCVKMLNLVCRQLTAHPHLFRKLKEVQYSENEIGFQLQMNRIYGSELIIKFEASQLPGFATFFDSFGEGIFEGCRRKPH